MVNTWLIACESSGRVRDRMIARGIKAISCDILPTERPGPHIQGDVRPLLKEQWAGVIAHPPCTRLCNSGVRWLAERNLWEDMKKGAEFFLDCLNANAPYIAVENPVMHKYAVEIIGCRQDFSIQPWQFGDNFTKRTCFWTKNLAPLKSTSSLDGKTAIAEVWKLPPSEERTSLRSKTYWGIADAIAEQWGLNYASTA